MVWNRYKHAVLTLTCIDCDRAWKYMEYQFKNLTFSTKQTQIRDHNSWQNDIQIHNWAKGILRSSMVLLPFSDSIFKINWSKTSGP